MNEVGLKVVDHEISNEKGIDWVYIAVTKQALDYIREGIAIKANQLEREIVREGEEVRPRFEFANQLKTEINKARERFDQP